MSVLVEGLTIMVVMNFASIVFVEMVLPHKDTDKKD